MAPTIAPAMVNAIGPEDAPLHALEREDRQQRRDQNQLREKHRPAEGRRRMTHQLAEILARRRKHFLNEHGLDDHHRRIDKNAEVDRAKAQQIGGNPFHVQENERRQQRQRNHQPDDKRRPEVACENQ